MVKRKVAGRVVAAIMAAAAVVGLAACGAAGSSAAGGAAASGSATGTPKAGGTITVGGLLTSLLDPGQAGYSAQSGPMDAEILGQLFLPPATATGPIQPDLATGYSYSDENKVLTITLRSGVKFSDGTPMNVSAVLWNLDRYNTPASLNHQYFTEVSSMKAGAAPNTIQITFKEPYTLLPTALSSTAAGYMASPTSFKQLGAAKFMLQPVGAGPFKVSSVNPGNKVVLAKSADYWDAAHVYLNQVTYLNTGTDSSAYVDLQSGAIQSNLFPGTTITATVVSEAMKNPSLGVIQTPSTFYSIMPIDTFKAPFNNVAARQALAYCTDRQAITQSVTMGLTQPAYILSGAQSSYLADGVNTAKSLNPLGYDPSKGTALVKQLGGLSFTLIEQTPSDIVTALQQEWAQCGIHANIDIANSYLTNIEDGQYQIAYTTVPNASYNPLLWTTYQNQQTPQGKYGFSDAQITSMIDQAKTLTDTTQLETLWHQIWTREASLVVDLPVLTAPNYIANAKCLQGVQSDAGGAQYANAYLAC
ncbi:MAG TPA: ABC transporter substrate-binding protein [Trebonia sp.]